LREAVAGATSAISAIFPVCAPLFDELLEELLIEFLFSDYIAR